MGAGQQALLGYGAAASSFSPSDVSGLTLWLKADAITGKSDGDLISQWDDSGSHAYHVTASGGLRPTYKVNIENGKPAVLFSGAQYLTGTTRDNLIGVFHTIFVVAKIPDLSLGGVAQYFLADNGTRLISFSSLAGHLTGRFTTTLGTFDVDAGAATDNQIFILDQRHASPYEIKFSGGTLVQDANGVNAFTTASGTDLVYFGGKPSVSRFVTGYIFEYIIYDVAVSDANRTSIRNYLATKYGFVYS